MTAFSSGDITTVPKFYRVGGLEHEYDLSSIPEVHATRPKHENDISYLHPAISAQHLPFGLKRRSGMLSNGARFYKDDGLEYATPEVLETDDLRWLDEIVAIQKSGQRIVAHTLLNALDAGDISAFSLHQRGGRQDGNPWSTQENLSALRGAIGPIIDFPLKRNAASENIDLLVTAMAVRSLFFGSGAMYQGSYILGQKCSQLNVEANSDAVNYIPLINTKDEPLAESCKYRRMHLTAVDPLLSPLALKASIAFDALILSMVEAGERAGDLKIEPGQAQQLGKMVATDPTFQKRWTLANKEQVLPIEIIGELIHRGDNFLAKKRGGGTASEQWGLQTVKELHEGFLEDPWQLTSLDWAARRRHIVDSLAAQGLAWNEGTHWQEVAAHSAREFDIIASSTQIGKRTVMETLEQSLWSEWMPDESLIEERLTIGPPGRARLRGEAVTKDPDHISWEKVISRHPFCQFFPDPHSRPTYIAAE